MVIISQIFYSIPIIMKKSISFSLFFLMLIILALVSCTKTDSTTTPSGDDRAKFLGSWNVSETHNKGSFVVTIKADPNEASRVLIDNFANLLPGNQATAYISGNSITLDANQSVGNMINISGNGTMTGSTTINWTYTMTDGATRIDATAVYTKK